MVMEEGNAGVDQPLEQPDAHNTSGTSSNTSGTSSNTSGTSSSASCTVTTATGQHYRHQPMIVPTPQIARQLGLNYCLSRTAAEILSQVDFVPQCSYKVMPPRQFPSYELSIWSDIGNRRTQEDRFVFCHELIRRRNDTGFFGVFDGTVGDFASENVKLLVVPHLVGSPPWPRIVELIELAEKQGLRRGSTAPEPSEKRSEQITDGDHTSSSDGRLGNSSAPTNESGSSESATPIADRAAHTAPEKRTETSSGGALPKSASAMEDKSITPTQPDELHNTPQADAVSPPCSTPVLTESLLDIELPPLISSAMDWMYLNSDTELVQLCARHDKHYSSCTSVTVLILSGYCGIGHLGDSRVALGYQRMGMLYGEFLTLDHKPNMPSEQDRILRSGGSVEYLHNHNNKPFIRGGDFTMRKAKGEQPMQLQYSRAFGGKDLKMYGLSNEPDLRVFKIDTRHNVLILASDGIWDVQSAAKAVEIVLGARRRGENPALTLITLTLQEQRIKNQNADNLTTIVIFLEYGKALSWSSSSSSSAGGISSSSGETSNQPHNPGHNQGHNQGHHQDGYNDHGYISNVYRYGPRDGGEAGNTGNTPSQEQQQLQYSCNDFR